MFEQRILLLHDARLHYQQNEQHYAERLELLGVLAVDYALCLTLLELRKLVVQLLLSVVGVVYMDVCATTGTGYITTHVLVESRHNDVTGVVADILTTPNGNWRALCATYAENEYIDAFLTRFLCCLQCSAFMVFAISDESDSLAYALLLSETASERARAMSVP